MSNNPVVKQKASVAKPWLQFYPEPLRTFVQPEDSLTEFIAKNNTDHNKEVIEYYGKTFTLNQIFEERDKVAAALCSMGVESGDRIVVFLKAVPEFIFVLLAAEKIGAVNTVVNRNGKLYGYNTDFGGLKMLIEKCGFDYEDKKVLGPYEARVYVKTNI